MQNKAVNIPYQRRSRLMRNIKRLAISYTAEYTLPKILWYNKAFDIGWCCSFNKQSTIYMLFFANWFGQFLTYKAVNIPYQRRSRLMCNMKRLAISYTEEYTLPKILWYNKAFDIGWCCSFNKQSTIYMLFFANWFGQFLTYIPALPPFVNRMDFMPNFSQLSYHKPVSKWKHIFW